MAIKIEMLRYFVETVRRGNLANAADSLGRTQAAVSIMLKQLEENLGAPLFVSKRKNDLTPLGAFVFTQAQRELDHFNATISSIKNYASAKSGYIRIASVPSFARIVLSDSIREFKLHCPEVKIDLQDMNSDRVVREIDKERAEIGFATVAKTQIGIKSHPIFSDCFGVVCVSDHPLVDVFLEKQKQLVWGDIEKILNNADEKTSFITNDLCKQIPCDDFQKFCASATLNIQNTTSLLAFIKDHKSITVLPQLVVEDIKENLTFLPVLGAVTYRQIYAISRAHEKRSPASRFFLETVQNTITNKKIIFQQDFLE